jgi:hypothetical protein
VGGVLLYVEQDLLANLPKDSDCLEILMGDYGKWRIAVHNCNEQTQ